MFYGVMHTVWCLDREKPKFKKRFANMQAHIHMHKEVHTHTHTANTCMCIMIACKSVYMYGRMHSL